MRDVGTEIGTVDGARAGRDDLGPAPDADLELAVHADELGPVDYLVVELPPGRRTFAGEVAMELVALVDAGLIRLLDLVVIEKAACGAVTAYEIDELDHVDEVRGLGGELVEVLAAQDVADLAAAVEPGTAAGVLVWESTWASPLAAAARRAGGQVAATGRIAFPALADSIGADAGAEADAAATDAAAPEASLGRERAATHRPVLGGPVARAPVPIAAALAVAQGLDRRRVQRRRARRDGPSNRPRR